MILKKTKTTKSVFLYLFIFCAQYTAKLIKLFKNFTVMWHPKKSKSTYLGQLSPILIYYWNTLNRKNTSNRKYLLSDELLLWTLMYFSVIEIKRTKTPFLVLGSFNSLNNGRRNQKHHKIWTHQTTLKYILKWWTITKNIQLFHLP